MDSIAKFYKIQKYSDKEVEALKREFRVWDKKEICFLEYLMTHYKDLLFNNNNPPKKMMIESLFETPKNLKQDMREEINRLVSSISQNLIKNTYEKIKIEKLAIDRLDYLIDNYPLNDNRKFAFFNLFFLRSSIEIKQDNIEK